MKAQISTHKCLWWILLLGMDLQPAAAAPKATTKQIPAQVTPAVAGTPQPVQPSAPQTLFERLRGDFKESTAYCEKGPEPPLDGKVEVQKALLSVQKQLQVCLDAEDVDCFNRGHFFVGRCYAASGDLVNVLNAYDRYLSQVQPTEGENRSATWRFISNEVAKLYVEARKLGVTRLLVQSKQDFAQFDLDGTMYRIVPGSTLHLWVPAGKHILRWGAPSAGKRTLNIEPELASMHVQLGIPDPPPPEVTAVPPVPPMAKPLKRAPRWALIGAGIPFLFAGGFLVTGGAVGYSVDGKCVDETCGRVYDAHVAAPAYLGSGIGSIALGILFTTIGGYGRLPPAQPTTQAAESAPRPSGLAQ